MAAIDDLKASIQAYIARVDEIREEVLAGGTPAEREAALVQLKDMVDAARAKLDENTPSTNP